MKIIGSHWQKGWTGLPSIEWCPIAAPIVDWPFRSPAPQRVNFDPFGIFVMINSVVRYSIATAMMRVTYDRQ